VQTVKDMGIPKIIAIPNRDESNAQVINQCHRKRDLVMTEVSSVVAISCELQGMYDLQRPTKETYLPPRLKQYTPPAQINQTLYTQPGVTYAQPNKIPALTQI
jgi:hypothetical protein